MSNPIRYGLDTRKQPDWFDSHVESNQILSYGGSGSRWNRTE